MATAYEYNAALLTCKQVTSSLGACMNTRTWTDADTDNSGTNFRINSNSASLKRILEDSAPLLRNKRAKIQLLLLTNRAIVVYFSRAVYSGMFTFRQTQ